eukprot:COSAG05_NODE_550_length_8736_cov_153.546254_3_plen_62_part_00
MGTGAPIDVSWASISKADPADLKLALDGLGVCGVHARCAAYAGLHAAAASPVAASSELLSV